MCARLGLEQGVVQPALGLVDVGVGRNDVVIAGEHHRAVELPERARAGDQTLEPGELVVELGAGAGLPLGR